MGELLTLTFESIDFAAETVRVPTEKRRGRVRVVPLHPELRARFEEHFSAARRYGGVASDTRLFGITRQRVGQVIREAAQKAGLSLERAGPHRLRHSFAIHCVLNGVPPFVLAEWMGHACVESTFIYAKVLARDSREFYDRIVW